METSGTEGLKKVGDGVVELKTLRWRRVHQRDRRLQPPVIKQATPPVMQTLSLRFKQLRQVQVPCSRKSPTETKVCGDDSAAPAGRQRNCRSQLLVIKVFLKSVGGFVRKGPDAGVDRHRGPSSWTVIAFLRRFFALSDDLCCFLLLQSQNAMNASDSDEDIYNERSALVRSESPALPSYIPDSDLTPPNGTPTKRLKVSFRPLSLSSVSFPRVPLC